MAPTSSNNSNEDTNNASSAKRVLFMRKLIEERKVTRSFEKARRSGIRAASEPHKPFATLSPDPTINLKLIIDKHSELASTTI
jgi:hypothetical protein